MKNLFYIYITFAAAMGAVGAAPMPRAHSIAVDADASDAAASLGHRDAASAMLADEQNNIVSWGKRQVIDADVGNNIVAWGSKLSRGIHTNAARDYITPGVPRPIGDDEYNSIVARKDQQDVDYITSGVPRAIDADNGNNIVAWGG
ncbi:hypothetical protein NLG97_g4168 [Lecanicillium saksenae]|uniref:Uncharacterized protein n=1 Tax=Lecanicillium saksenae TaxID=468837 RepID=A0ACC1QW26_9HYPO|nr:hypothetical protein NLG97_g4168 [Lecanicillium saksenae]